MTATKINQLERSLNSEFVATRWFAAPLELVFEVWTQCEHLAHWFGPKHVTIVSCQNDLRPSGVMHHGMRMPNGTTLWGRWVYREIAKLERLIFVASFSDENRGITRNPLSAGWPLETVSTITFREQRGGTILTLAGAPHNATELERTTFENARASIEQEWTGTFNQLDSYLSTANQSN